MRTAVPNTLPTRPGPSRGPEPPCGAAAGVKWRCAFGPSVSDNESQKVALGLAYAHGRVDDQFARVNQIQGTLGVLLGFVVTAIGLIFSSGKTWTAQNLGADAVALACLMAAGTIFGFGLALFRLYRDPEDIVATVGLGDESVSFEAAQHRLLDRYLRYYQRNKQTLRRRFFLVNVGLALLLLGIFAFAFGNLPY